MAVQKDLCHGSHQTLMLMRGGTTRAEISRVGRDRRIGCDTVSLAILNRLNRMGWELVQMDA
jgi:hypothetical protein